MGRFMGIFQEDNGEFSSMRVVVMLWNVCLIAVWTYVSLLTGQMAPIDAGVLAGMGIMQASKVGQKIVESKV